MLSFVLMIAFASAPNAGGGEIVLTTDTLDECGAEMRVAYTTSPEHDTQLGCWMHDERMVHIKWLVDGSIRSYPIEMFQKIQGG